MSEGFLRDRLEQRASEFEILDRVRQTLQSIARTHDTLGDTVRDNVTPAKPLPFAPEWKVTVASDHGSGLDLKSIKTTYGVHLFDPVELLLSPDIDEAGEPMDPILDETAGFSILIDSDGALDENAGRRLSETELRALADDIEEYIVPLFPLAEI